VEQFREEAVDGATFVAEQSPYPRPLTRKFDSSFAMSRRRVVEVLFARLMVIPSVFFGALILLGLPTQTANTFQMWLYVLALGICVGVAFLVSNPSRHLKFETQQMNELPESGAAGRVHHKDWPPAKVYVAHSGSGSRQIVPFTIDKHMGISLGLYQHLTEPQLYALRCWFQRRTEAFAIGSAVGCGINCLFSITRAYGLMWKPVSTSLLLLLAAWVTVTFFIRRRQENQLRAIGLWEPLQEALRVQRELCARLPWYIRPIYDLRFGFRRRQDVE
jgi:hypothetical protein